MTRKFIVGLIFAAVVFAIALVFMFATPAAAGEQFTIEPSWRKGFYILKDSDGQRIGTIRESTWGRSYYEGHAITKTGREIGSVERRWGKSDFSGAEVRDADGNVIGTIE